MMGKRRSFKEFIAENFEDQIYQSVERYYNANETRIRYFYANESEGRLCIG